MPERVEEVSLLREELSTLNVDQDRLMGENKVVLALGTEIFEFKATTGSIVGSLQEVKVRTVEILRDQREARKTVAVSDSNQKTLLDIVLSLKEKLSSIRVELAYLRADLKR